MLFPMHPDNEFNRLEALRNLQLLDTEYEERFDRLTQLAKQTLNVPIALVSLVDEERQWFKSKQGLDACETARDISFCAHAILADQIFEVPDTFQDARFADNPLVTGYPNIRFYAGMPISSPDGFRVGTLCVISNQPRTLTSTEQDILKNLAGCVEAELEHNYLYRQSAELTLSKHLGEVVSVAQAKFITDDTKREAFDYLLSQLLKLTGSAFGFIGEILKDVHGQPYLKSYALTDISWSAETKTLYDNTLSAGLEFRNLDTLFGWAIKNKATVISNNPAADGRRGGLPPGHPPLNTFLGVPVFHEGEMVAMFGLANRPGGYDESIVTFLQPFISTLGQLVDAARLKKLNESTQNELARLSGVARYTSNGVIITDDQAHIDWVNEGFSRLTEYSLDDVKGMSLKALLFRNQSDERVKTIIEQCIDDKKAFSLELSRLTKTGKPYWVKVECNPIVGPHQEFKSFIVVKTDLTAEKHVQKSLQHFKSTLDQVLDCVFMFDAKNLQFFYVNEGALRQVGYSQDDLYTMHPYDIQPDFSETSFRAFIQPLIEGQKQSITFETEHLNQAQKRIPVEVFLQYVALPEDKAHFVAIVRDITERKHNQDLLTEQVMHTQAIIEHMVDGLITVDKNSAIQSFNPAAESIFGYQADEIIGSNISRLFVQHEAESSGFKWHHLVDSFKAHPQGIEFDVIGIRKDGKQIPIELSVSETKQRGYPVYVALVSDISVRKENEETLRYLATHDSLTNLPNRFLLRERLEHTLLVATHQANSHSVLMMVDLDNFKIINDSFGHQQGDTLLMEIAARLSKMVVDGNTLARLGGDEFAIIFNNIASVSDAEAIAQGVLELLKQPVILNNQEVTPTASLGYCMIPEDGQDPDTLLRHADIAMYAAKAAGKGTSLQFRFEQSASAAEDLNCLSRLRKALNADALTLHYQPQVNTATGMIIGAEALLRWTDEMLGPMSPAKFIPVAEASGLILPLGDWVIDTATKQIALWHQNGLDITVAINISPYQFRQVDLVDKVKKACLKHGCPHRLLEIEITEQVAMASPEITRSQLKALTDEGFSIALDDFGTGHSSLARLGQLPVKKLKIDQSFIKEIPGDNVYETIVRTTIGLAYEMGMALVAEGVETEDQRAFLHRYGCKAYQGWLYSKAVPAAEFTSLMHKRA